MPMAIQLNGFGVLLLGEPSGGQIILLRGRGIVNANMMKGLDITQMLFTGKIGFNPIFYFITLQITRPFS